MEAMVVQNNQTISIADYVQRWGNAASIALFDPAYQIFQVPTIDGIIGYRSIGKCVVVFGDPVCSPDDWGKLVPIFHNHFNRLKKRIVYTTVSERFVTWALQHGCSSAIGIGDEFILDPTHDPRARKGYDASSLRNKYTYSVRQGITVHEYTGHDVTLETELEQVACAWLKNRKKRQLHQQELNLFDHRSNKRWFYAEHHGKKVGVLMLNRLNALQGWVMNMLMRIPNCPTTTTEFMVMSALEILAAEGCNFFSIGTVPGSTIGKIYRLGRLSTWCAQASFIVGRKFFDKVDRHRYWKKFAPRSEPTYVLFDRDRVTLHEVWGIMRAYNISMGPKI